MAAAGHGLQLPIIDVAPLLGAIVDESSRPRQADRDQAWSRIERRHDVHECIAQIGRACRETGFFYVRNHNIPKALQQELDEASAAFFAQPEAEKAEISMRRGGKAWRGWFPVGDELTSGLVDQKEGIYFGTELPSSDQRPMHGPNLFPQTVPKLRPTVLAYTEACAALGHLLMRAIAASLRLNAGHFGEQFREPLALFRIFHYPPHDPKHGEDSLAVGEHTDYGYITMLRQDSSGGLQVRSRDGEHWIEAPPIPDTLLINLGDALEHNTGGLLRATAHRVPARRNALQGRFSYPFFFDPSFDAQMQSVLAALPPELQREAEAKRSMPRLQKRWDGRCPEQFSGTYGAYVLGKVSKVFPQLAEAEHILGGSEQQSKL